MFKFLIDNLVLNKNWTSLGKYMIPNKINYTNELGDDFGGRCQYNFFTTTITIRPKYLADIGILEHERSHARQYGRLFWLHSALSMFSRWYKLLIELEAYRAQVGHYRYAKKEQYEWIIESIDNKYKTRVSKEKIRAYADYAFKDLIEEKI